MGAVGLAVDLRERCVCQERSRAGPRGGLIWPRAGPSLVLWQGMRSLGRRRDDAPISPRAHELRPVDTRLLLAPLSLP